ncbi:hypothetical protein HJFPF1_04935 [Paramyrothecium foliicola]|nr:hypothetical protein HJFPF1_04935 [Paramyrothecium foliicola]
MAETVNDRTPLLARDETQPACTEMGLPFTDEALKDVPENIRRGLTLNRSPFGDYSYTWWPEKGIDVHNVPLHISDIPVVIPVHCSGGSRLEEELRCPPDPRSEPIDPGTCLPDKIAEDILDLWSDARGFHILIDGQLQILVPLGFNFARAFKEKPRRYGGLRVSYVLGQFDVDINDATSIKRESEVTLDHIIEQGDRRAPWYFALGRFGVRTECNGSQYLTAPTHIHYTPFKNPLLGEMKLQPSDHTVRVAHTGDALFNRSYREPVKPFDPEPQSWPWGSAHDVSLYTVAKAQFPLARAPVPTTWLPETEWRSLRYHDTDLATFASLKDEYHPGPSPLRRHFPIVGQSVRRWPYPRPRASFKALFPNMVGTKSRDDQGHGLNRSLLFRMPARHTYAASGRAVCVMDKRGDKSVHAKVAGFISYSQITHEIHEEHPYHVKYPAFFGAFTVPGELIEQHVIV